MSAQGAFIKVSEREGSTPGGWFKHLGTSELWYIKKYHNPDNARIEYIANAIYRAAQICAPVSKLLISGNDVYIASKKVGNGVRASKEEQKASVDIQGGFIVDAYLNNWDVVGEFFDNIVKDENGRLYRVDNGGCGPLRANGKIKPFPAHRIDELDDMRNIKFHAGQVFEHVSEESMKIQTRKFISTFDFFIIDHVIKESGLTGEVARMMRNGLVGRRLFLTERFFLNLKDGMPLCYTQ